MTISFEQIPSTLRTPGVYVEISNANAVRGPALKAYRALLIGQRLSTGSVAAGIPTRLTSSAQARTYFGRASMLERMAIAWFANNPVTEVWAIALDDNGAGVQAAGTATVTGTATAAGTIALYVGGQRVQVSVAAGDGQNTIAAAINTAIAAALDLPVTATVGSNVVTMTARHKGEVGNAIDIRHSYDPSESLPAGVSLALSGSGLLASGATNPLISTAVTAMADVQYDIIAHPYLDSTNLTALKTELDSRWGPLEMIEGHAITAMNGAFATVAAFGAARNDAGSTIFDAGKSPTPTYEQASALAGVVAYYGQIDPARPFQTLALAGVLAPSIADRRTQAERNLLLFDGISTSKADADGTVRIDRVITTYQTNAAGAEDISYLDLNTRLTLAYLRYDLRNFFLTAYPRHKLAADGTRFKPGQAVVTPGTAKLALCSRFSEWEERGLVEDFDQFKRDMLVEINASIPTQLDIRISPNVVNQLIVIATQIAFVL